MSAAQRWRERVEVWREGGELFRSGAFEVAPIDERAAKTFVVTHHYSGTYPAARRRFGLFCLGLLVGVAVFSVPVSAGVFACFPWPPASCLELGRLVLLDEVPAPGESWFVARCFGLLRAERFRGVVSFSDPVPRLTADGRTVMPGHIGQVYQALSARYLGRGTARTLRLLPSGRVLSPRSLQKIRAGERGWEYAAAQLEDAGAPHLSDPRDGEGAAWLRAWLPKLTRPLRHPGNHRYAWALGRGAAQRALPASLPYPQEVAP